jgi:predicted PhzF superfamily epimerase YddE/YHI9
VATAHALVERGLFESRLVKSEETSLVGSIIFKTKCRGSLTTNVLKTDNSTVIYELNFPSSRPTAKPLSTEDREHLCSSLRITSDDIIFEGQGIDDIVIELKPEAFHQVPTCSSGLIDFNRLNSVSTPRGVIITCTGPSDHNADFLSRFYCPK